MNPMSPPERAMALQRVNADLLWLILDDNWTRARTVLGNSEIQSELRAQRYDHVGGRSTGDIDYADPTGEAVARTASDEVRAGVIERTWRHELLLIVDHIARVVEITSILTNDPTPKRVLGNGWAGQVQTVDRWVSWLLLVPQNRLEHAVSLCDDELRREVDASIAEAADDAQALRSGKLYHHTPDGVQVSIPSVHSVLHSARKVLARKAAEPVPQNKDYGCANHRRFGLEADLSADSATWCDRCRNFRRREGVMPTEAILRHWEIHPRSYPPPRLIIEAKARKKRKKAS